MVGGMWGRVDSRWVSTQEAAAGGESTCLAHLHIAPFCHLHTCTLPCFVICTLAHLHIAPFCHLHTCTLPFFVICTLAHLNTTLFCHLHTCTLPFFASCILAHYTFLSFTHLHTCRLTQPFFPFAHCFIICTHLYKRRGEYMLCTLAQCTLAHWLNCIVCAQSGMCCFISCVYYIVHIVCDLHCIALYCFTSHCNFKCTLFVHCIALHWCATHFQPSCSEWLPHTSSHTPASSLHSQFYPFAGTKIPVCVFFRFSPQPSYQLPPDSVVPAFHQWLIA